MGGDEKKIAQAIQEEFAGEVNRLLGRVLPDPGSGPLDLEASEAALRTSMHQVGGVLLERLLNSDGGSYQGPRVACGQGHEAEFVDYRSKTVLTVLAAVKVERAYYHCAQCAAGVIPKDRDLDIVATSFSPGVRRLMGRVGGKEAFDEGRQDLEELAGIRVQTKQVERVAEAIGRQIEVAAAREREAAFAGKLLTMATVAKLYIAIDGTGVPVVPRETLGRRGRQELQAKTREAKLGCVFTQTRLDERGRPMRDPESTSYVGAIETAQAFGCRIYAEAVRRGLGRAQQIIVLGDGADWIWGLADEHFPGATQIVDLYHAREHVALLARLLYQPGSAAAQKWLAARVEELDEGNIEVLLRHLRRLHPAQEATQKEARKAIGYFESNAERMRYARFRQQGLFVGSGVVEAGCKTIIGQRLKQSGMRWTIRGANDIIALRCCQLSGRWEEFWEGRAQLATG